MYVVAIDKLAQNAISDVQRLRIFPGVHASIPLQYELLTPELPLATSSIRQTNPKLLSMPLFS